jgi:hypothetical protein
MQLIDRSDVRLTFGDDLFLRRHRGLGSPVVNQFVWRFDEQVPTVALLRMRDALAQGALARQAHRSVVPAARARWSRVVEPPEIVRRDDVLGCHEVMSWLRLLGTTRLDPSRGDSWRLAVADLSDGGSVVSLLADHAVADGGAMVDAVERAASGRPPLPVPSRSGLAVTVAADLHDAATQVTAVSRWAAARVRPALAGSRSPRRPRPATHDDGRDQRAVRVPSDGWTPPVVVVECSTAQVVGAAARHGGSTNAWFVAVSASLAATAGIAVAGRPVRVALPVSARTTDDLRSNATRIAHVDVDVDDPAVRDLAGLRARCKHAYAALGAASPPSAGTSDGSLLTLVQMMPTALVRRLPQPAPATVLASNLGTVSDAFRSPTGPEGPRARSIVAMAGQRRVDQAELDSLGSGLMAWTCTSGEHTTVTVTALDPVHVPDDATLLDVTTTVLSAWDVEARPW